MPPRPITRLRKLCLALPEAHEVKAWGEPTFRVRNKMFAMYADAANHHGGGRPAVWLKANRSDQARMVRADSGRFFVPPYVGPSGWVGVWLDQGVDWGGRENFSRTPIALSHLNGFWISWIRPKMSGISAYFSTARFPSLSR